MDYEVQFQKTFLDPMRFILGAIGAVRKQATLETFLMIKLYNDDCLKSLVDEVYKLI